MLNTKFIQGDQNNVRTSTAEKQMKDMNTQLSGKET